MGKQIGWLVVAAAGLMASCSSTGGGTNGGRGGAGSNSSLTSIDIGLPNRDNLKSQVPDIESKMNGYHIKISGSGGTDCVSVDKVAPYASKSLSVSLKQGCDYQLTLALGQLASGGDSGQTTQINTIDKVDYTTDLKPVVDANCATSGCHNGSSSSLSDLRTYSGLKAAGTISVQKVENGSMPRGGFLSASEKEMFSAWQRDGFLETQSTGSSGNTGSSSSTLGSIYYTNPTPVRVSKSEIQGKSSVKVDLRLFLQPDGQAIGLGQVQTNTQGQQSQDQQQVQPNNTVTAPNLPSNKNPSLRGQEGEVKLAELFKGDYMMLDFSQYNCGYCRITAEEMNNSAELQGYFEGGKCSHATIVLGNDLNSWLNYIGGGQTFSGKHSYVETSGNGYDVATTFIGGGFGTPTFVIIDREGNTVGSPSNGIPENQLAQLCR